MTNNESTFGEGGEVSQLHKQILGGDNILSFKCLKCGLSEALFIVDGRYVGLCPSCVLDRIAAARQSVPSLPAWVDILEFEARHEVAYQRDEAENEFALRLDDFYKCASCGKLVHQKDARYYIPPQGHSSPPYCEACYEDVSNNDAGEQVTYRFDSAALSAIQIETSTEGGPTIRGEFELGSSQVRIVGSRDSATIVSSVPLARVSSILETLAEARIPARPTSGFMGVAGGVTLTLNRGLNRSSFHWAQRVPEGWEPLGEAVRELLRLLPPEITGPCRFSF